MHRGDLSGDGNQNYSPFINYSFYFSWILSNIIAIIYVPRKMITAVFL